MSHHALTLTIFTWARQRKMSETQRHEVKQGTRPAKNMDGQNYLKAMFEKSERSDLMECPFAGLLDCFQWHGHP